MKRIAFLLALLLLPASAYAAEICDVKIGGNSSYNGVKIKSGYTACFNHCEPMTKDDRQDLQNMADATSYGGDNNFMERRDGCSMAIWRSSHEFGK